MALCGMMPQASCEALGMQTDVADEALVLTRMGIYERKSTITKIGASHFGMAAASITYMYIYMYI